MVSRPAIRFRPDASDRLIYLNASKQGNGVYPNRSGYGQKFNNVQPTLRLLIFGDEGLGSLKTFCQLRLR